MTRYLLTIGLPYSAAAVAAEMGLLTNIVSILPSRTVIAMASVPVSLVGDREPDVDGVVDTLRRVLDCDDVHAVIEVA